MPQKPGDPLKVGDKVRIVMGHPKGQGEVIKIDHPKVTVRLEDWKEYVYLNWQLVLRD